MIQQQAVRSRVNQPERVLIRSDDDTTQSNVSGYFQFQVNLPTPVLDPKRCQIIRTTIPNIQLQIPDYQCVFFYHKLATATTAPSNATLRAVRLFPSYYQAPAGLAYTPTKNRYITDPNDLVSLLNTAAAAGGDAVAANPYWNASDVTFAYNAITKQITMTGNGAGLFYTPAGWNDPIVRECIAGNGAAGIIRCPTYLNAAAFFNQPLVDQYTLNLRVGYAMSGNSFGLQGNGNRLYANIVNVAFPAATAVPADSYPDLVYTNHVAVYASFITSSSLTSNNRHNLLCVVPMQAVSLSLNNYIAATSNLLTKLSQTISNITIELRDQADQPYMLSDSVSCDFEISFSYQDKVF